jgi:UDP-glucose 4-epimerase
MVNRYLVTGGAGFIGSHVVRELLRRGSSEVVVLDDFSGGFRDNVPAGVTVEAGSITDQALLKQLFAKYKFSYVFHLAAYAAEGLSHFIRNFNYNNNLIGSINLINESVIHDVKCFVFTSSIAVYGAGQVPMREDMMPEPEDPYGIAKFAVEMDLMAAMRTFGLNYVIFRPHNVYGEFQNIGDKYRNVIGIFMNQIMQGKPMTIFGDGTQKRAFTYVGDIVPPIVDCVQKPQAYGRVFNVGADIPYTVNTLAAKVAKVMDKPNHPVVHLDARNEVKAAWSDHSSVQKLFGAASATSLDEGLARMVEWVRTVGARKSKDFDNIEIARGLPPSWVNK